MRKSLCLLLLSFTILLAPSCKNEEPSLITDREAKEAIMEHNPEAIILECFYDENVASYIIEFKTFYGLYEGVVNAHTGNITSIAIKPEEDSAPMFEPPSEDEEEESFLPHETALAIAISDSEISGTAAVVKNDLDREKKTYNIIFRSGTTEYTYIIDAVTGDILSFDVVMDS